MTVLSDLLRPLRVWADVLVVSANRFREAAAVPGTLYHTVAREGKVLYRYEGDADEDEERLARQEVRENLRRLRAWVEARLSSTP